MRPYEGPGGINLRIKLKQTLLHVSRETDINSQVTSVKLIEGCNFCHETLAFIAQRVLYVIYFKSTMAQDIRLSILHFITNLKTEDAIQTTQHLLPLQLQYI